MVIIVYNNQFSAPQQPNQILKHGAGISLAFIR